MKIFPTVVLALFSLFPLCACSSPDVAARARTVLAPPAWLAGEWRGQGFGGDVVEWWSREEGGRMFGAFQLTNQGQPVFYELFNLVREEDEWTMRLRHFNHPGLEGWEDAEGAQVWSTTVFEGRRIGFGPVTYVLLSPDEVEVSIRLTEGEREHTERFTMRRVAGR